MKNKFITLEEAIENIKDGSTIMVGGFLANGTPERLVDELLKSGKKDLTLICNDTGFVDKGVGKLIVNKQIKKVIASHIGTNKETGRQMNKNELEVILVPQGTLAEQVRAAAFGLGGALTKTGLGTKVEEGKQIVEVNGEKYILEKPLKADVALVFADKVDKKGNMKYKGSENNFNNLMAMAADVTIVEARNIVEVGDIDQNEVVTPHIFINYIVRNEVQNG